jgi:TetR/AcrR family transcriptional repressor of mexJK operon
MGANKPKRDAILEIASAAFLEHGYRGASVNEMSRLSGISKETIYRYFRSKKELFAAVLDQELDHYQRSIVELDRIDQDKELRDVLTLVGGMLLKLLLRKRTMALRLLIFNAGMQQPEIGQLYNERGPRPAIAALQRYFDRLKSRGLVSPFDALELADDFMAMLLHKVVLQYELNLGEKLAYEDVDEYVGRVVDRFLASHF